MERSLSSSESQNLSNSASLKAQRMDHKSIQKEKAELNSVKTALEHKVHHLENSCVKLKEALKTKIKHEERRDLNEKNAFHKLQEKAHGQSFAGNQPVNEQRALYMILQIVEDPSLDQRCSILLRKE